MSSFIWGVLLFVAGCFGWATFDVMRWRRRNHGIGWSVRVDKHGAPT